ncbi:MAG: TnsA-like heteromeric transposase endonuclease subunit [Propionicimonas sp.]
MGYLDADGEQHAPLASCADVGFERCPPVRAFPSYRGQRNWPGLWWFATTGSHVGFESWLERDHVMRLDFDREVVGLASQPFWLFWAVDGESRRHAPDFFVRRRDGSAVVVDCRPDHRIRPRDVQAFEATAAACEVLGWEFERVGSLDPVLAGNLRWLAGYRQPRFADPAVGGRLREVFGGPRRLMDGVSLVGLPMAVLPVLFHLLWRGELSADLSIVLSGRSVVWGGSR